MLDYDVMRDEVVPLLKDCSDNLCNFMSAHTAMMAKRDTELETAKILTRLEAQLGNLAQQYATFMQVQGTHEIRQRDLELKLTKVMAYGGAGITIVTLLIHYLGGH